MAPSSLLSSGFSDLGGPYRISWNAFLVNELLNEIKRFLSPVAHLVAQDGGDTCGG